MHLPRFWLTIAIWFIVGFVPVSAQTNYNYAEALQKSLFFYEAQQSGKLSPNNRVAWRGDACLTDGADVGRDLSGGWFDAGDHWTANLTMSFAAMTLAWAGDRCQDAFIQNEQMDELLESLIHVNRYFIKCVANPECTDPANELEVYVGCGGREGVPSPNVHAMWAPAEVAHLMTKRPAFKVTKKVPGGDIPAAMAAAMAQSSVVIRENGHLLKDKNGYLDFNSAKFADMLLGNAEKLWAFANANRGDDQGKALRSDGQIVRIGYRAGAIDKLYAAAVFIFRAHQARKSPEAERWLKIATDFYKNEYAKASLNDWWRDFGAGGFGKLASVTLAAHFGNQAQGAVYHRELQHYASMFCQYKQTPSGLRLREWEAHQWGSLRHANNAAFITLAYSELVTNAPALDGNTSFNKGKKATELQSWYFNEAKHQVDYALGANPYGRSYLVGFGNRPFNAPHHRGAFGAWAGFDHFIHGKADDRRLPRHILYGALIGGPDNHDVFLCEPHRKAKEELTPEGKKQWMTYYLFPNRTEPVSQLDYAFNRRDLPAQEVMDPKFNEVALDYNAGITASFSWLTAHGFSAGKPLPDNEFPTKIVKNDSLDLRSTDREFFVSGREVSKETNVTALELAIENRSRWPARVCTNLSFRYYFTLEEGMNPAQVTVTASSGKTRVAQITTTGPIIAFAEASFPGEVIYPGSSETYKRTLRFRLSAPKWNAENDWSHKAASSTPGVLPNIAVFENGKPLGGDTR